MPDAPAFDAVRTGTRISLRARPERAEALAQALGIALPTRIGAIASQTGWEAICLGPGEWRLDGDGDLPAADIPHAATDISDRELVWRLHGPGARDILAMGCPRDLRRAAPGIGMRTILDGASVILVCDAPDDWRIEVWRSFSPHLEAFVRTGQAELAAGL